MSAQESSQSVETVLTTATGRAQLFNFNFFKVFSFKIVRQIQSMNLLSAYLLTVDNMDENAKNWVDLGRLNSNYLYFSAFRFGEIIVAHRKYQPDAGIYMLTWDGENLEDHGVQINLPISGSTGIFIPKEDTRNA